MKYNAKSAATLVALVLSASVIAVTPVYAGESSYLLLAKSEAASGSGTSEAQACQQAKMSAQMYCNGKVESFGSCGCSSEVINGRDQWTCQVDAQCGELTGVVKPLYQ